MPGVILTSAMWGRMVRTTWQIAGIISKLREQIAKFHEYRTALISAAVTGKIDVRGSGADSAGVDKCSQIDEH